MASGLGSEPMGLLRVKALAVISPLKGFLVFGLSCGMWLDCAPARQGIFLSRAVIPGAIEPTRSNILRMNLSPTPRFELDTVHLGICPC